MLRLALILSCLAAPAAAEKWEVMYLTHSGGTRPMQVDPADLGDVDSVWMQAYVDNDRGERLFLDCRWKGGAASDLEWTLRLFPIVTFDGVEGTNDIGDFTFVQEGFWARVPDILATDIRQGRAIRLEMPAAYVVGGETYRTEFTLAGSNAALDKACPPL
jgi:hypothetical protein